jgi:NADPH-dependent glutamate synthase beta subunit-like oxidoreductase
VHAPVLTNRASSHTALPSSELSAVAPKQALFRRLQAGEIRIEATGLAAVVLFYGALPAGIAPGAVLAQHGQVAVIDLNPRVTARRAP